jgi:hypothetical protein
MFAGTLLIFQTRPEPDQYPQGKAPTPPMAIILNSLIWTAIFFMKLACIKNKSGIGGWIWLKIVLVVDGFIVFDL